MLQLKTYLQRKPVLIRKKTMQDNVFLFINNLKATPPLEAKVLSSLLAGESGFHHTLCLDIHFGSEDSHVTATSLFASTTPKSAKELCLPLSPLAESVCIRFRVTNCTTSNVFFSHLIQTHLFYKNSFFLWDIKNMFT